VKLFIYIKLDSGTGITIQGHDLDGDDFNEIIAMLAGKQIVASETRPEEIDVPLPAGKQERQCDRHADHAEHNWGRSFHCRGNGPFMAEG